MCAKIRLFTIHLKIVAPKLLSMAKILPVAGTRKNLLFIASFILAFILLIFCWIYRLDVLPGLHGDEAWSGIKAIYFNNHSVNQLNGMNSYTGILQALVVKTLFYYWGISVYNLRIAGVVFNLLAVTGICGIMIHHKYKKSALAFILILLQSALYLTSARVAWEVNTFSLFFISLLFISAVNIYHNSKNAVWVLIILITCFLGAYNHIIFSMLPLSIFIGLSFYTLYYSDGQFNQYIVLFGLGVINTAAAFCLTAYFSTGSGNSIDFILVLLVGIVLLELWVFKKCSNSSIGIPFPLNFTRTSVKLILLCGIACFLIFHGIAFIEVLSGYKIFLQNYSYESPLIIRVLLRICSIVFACFLINYLWHDLQNSKSAVFAFIMLTLLSVINVYTIKNSYRYYLVIYAVMGIYMACKLNEITKKSRFLIYCLAISFCIAAFIQLQVLKNNTRLIRVVNFKIGNKQTETSAHFLPKKPLVDYLKKHQAISIDCTDDNPYFLNLPIQFYNLQQPWQPNTNHKVMVAYDRINYKDGYLFFFEY